MDPTFPARRPRALPALALLLALAPALQAMPASAATGGEEPASETPQGGVGQDLEPGSNSFTEAQVRARFGRMGFGEVHDLRKDDQGIWHGKAMHAGKELSIRMDFRGNVAAE